MHDRNRKKIALASIFRHIAQYFHQNSGKKSAFPFLYFYGFSCIIVSKAIFLNWRDVNEKKA